MRTIDKPILKNVADAIASQRASRASLRSAARMVTVRPARDRKRLTKAQNEAVRELVLKELRACYSAVQSKRRDMPAWHRGYDSALSSIEERIASFEQRPSCVCPPNGGCTERCDRI